MENVASKVVSREGAEVIIRKAVDGVTTEDRRRIISAKQMIDGKLVDIPLDMLDPE